MNFPNESFIDRHRRYSGSLWNLSILISAQKCISSERDIKIKARVILDYTFRHYDEYFIARLSSGGSAR